MQSVLSESHTSVKRIAVLWFEHHSPTPNLRAFELLFMRIAVRPDPSVDPKGGAVLTTILPRILSWSGQCGPGLQHNTSRSAARGGGAARAEERHGRQRIPSYRAQGPSPEIDSRRLETSSAPKTPGPNLKLDRRPMYSRTGRPPQQQEGRSTSLWLTITQMALKSTCRPLLRF